MVGQASVIEWLIGCDGQASSPFAVHSRRVLGRVVAEQRASDRPSALLHRTCKGIQDQQKLTEVFTLLREFEQEAATVLAQSSLQVLAQIVP